MVEYITCTFLYLVTGFVLSYLFAKLAAESYNGTKENQLTLLMDLRMHMQWAEQNVQTLQSRAGMGLRGKLRQGDNIQERKIYHWLLRHETNIQLSAVLSATLRALDAQVNISPHMEYLLALNMHPRLQDFSLRVERAIFLP